MVEFLRPKKGFDRITLRVLSGIHLHNCDI